MAFGDAIRIDMDNVDSGVLAKEVSFVMSTTEYENGLITGRFAKLDTGILSKLDASATPVIAGVILKNPANAVEDGNTFTSENTTQVNYIRAGLVTVDVMSADSPTQFGTVYAKNTNDEHSGKASTVDDATTEATGAEFIREVKPNVWLIRLK